MYVENHAIDQLIKEIDIEETGKSSHWDSYLKNFIYSDNQFSAFNLPEGGGIKSNFFLKNYAHKFFQFPYLLMGRKYAEFNKILDIANQIYQKQNTILDLGSLRQVITLSFLNYILPIGRFNDLTLIIGDGFGAFSSMYFKCFKKRSIVINLTKNLLIDAVYIKKSLPDCRIALVKTEDEYRRVCVDLTIDFILVQADNAIIIKDSTIDLIVNIASMQEMEMKTINDYFSLFRSFSSQSQTFFYCANRVEKKLPSGSVIRMKDYPWSLQDKILINELCPWHQKYYAFKPPFYFNYIGKIFHRLVEIKKQKI